MADSIYYVLSRYTQPPIIILGSIGAILNLILFYYRKPLRATSCSLYFRALSANDFILLYIYVLLNWLSDQYGINPTNKYTWYCKGKSFIQTSLYTLSPYLVALACFDRLCTSSTNARLRRIATVRVASILIPCVTIFVFFTYFHIPIWYVLVSNQTVSVCTIVNQLYYRIFVIFLVVYLGFLPPILMSVLCTLTFILLRRQRRRVMPVNQIRSRQRDYQLLKMLFLYVVSHLICTIPFSISLLIVVYELPTPSASSILLFRLFVLLFNINFATSFYIYTLGTPFYRQELRSLIKDTHNRISRMIHRNRNQPILQSTGNAHVRRR